MTDNQIADQAQTATIHPHPAAMPNVAAVGRILSRYKRAQLEAFITVAIDLLDVVDGDSDLEMTGDELDAAWPERPAVGCTRALTSPIEDAEDDDPVEDDSQDRCEAGDDGCGAVIQQGVKLWGASQEDALRLAKPKYGQDQRVVTLSEHRGHGLNVDTMQVERLPE